MKKYVFLGIITCFALPFTSSCSFFNPSSNIEVSAPNAGTTESDNAASEGETTPSSDVEDSSYADSSVNADEAETTPDIHTIVGYVLSVDENTMYADLKNTGSRLYPGEGEDRKAAFDISNAEQVQTNISEFNPATANLISPGIQVTIAYYTKQDINYAIYVGGMS